APAAQVLINAVKTCARPVVGCPLFVALFNSWSPRPLFQLNVPFIPLPSVLGPPLAGGAPGPRGRDHLAAHSESGEDAHGPSGAYFDGRRQRRTKHAERHGRSGFGRLKIVDRTWMIDG